MGAGAGALAAWRGRHHVGKWPAPHRWVRPGGMGGHTPLAFRTPNAPSHLAAARGLRAAESRPKATLRIHMQMPMETGFYLFSECFKIKQPHKPTDSTKISASPSRFKWCLGLPCGPPYLSKGQLNINTAYFCDLALGGAGSSYIPDFEKNQLFYLRPDLPRCWLFPAHS